MPWRHGIQPFEATSRPLASTGKATFRSGACGEILGVPHNLGDIYEGPYLKDCSILGSVLGSAR